MKLVRIAALAMAVTLPLLPAAATEVPTTRQILNRAELDAQRRGGEELMQRVETYDKGQPVRSQPPPPAVSLPETATRSTVPVRPPAPVVPK